MQTITVTDARSVLPHILATVKSGGRDAVPILIGRHREPIGRNTGFSISLVLRASFWSFRGFQYLSQW